MKGAIIRAMIATVLMATHSTYMRKVFADLPGALSWLRERGALLPPEDLVRRVLSLWDAEGFVDASLKPPARQRAQR